MESMTESENSLIFYIEAFMPLLLERVKAEELLAYMPALFSGVDRKRILALKKTEPVEATRTLFTIFLESKDPGKFRMLLDALEEEYPVLVKALEGHTMPDEEHHRHIIQAFGTTLREKIVPTQILPILLSLGVLNRLDVQEITQEQEHYGSMQAAFVLLNYIDRRDPDWYKKFLKALFESDYAELVKEIDQVEYEKLLVQSGHSLSSLSTSSIASSDKCPSELDSFLNSVTGSVGEHFVEGSGEAEYPGVMSAAADGPRVADSQPVSLQSTINNEHVEIDQGNSFDPLQLFSLELKQDLGSLIPSTSAEVVVPVINTGTSSSFSTVSNQVRRETYPSISGSAQNDLSSEIALNTHQTESQDPLSLLSHALAGITVPGHQTNVKQVDDIPSGFGRGRGLSRDIGFNSQGAVSKYFADKELQFPRLPGQLSANIKEPEKVKVQDAEPEEEDKDIDLRDYQWELAKPAIEGKNVIIVAPTGSGKTRVALKVIQEHMRQKHGRQIPKVIFLVNQVALANQQGAACRELLRHYKTQVLSGEVQRTQKVSIKDYIDKRHILVVTAQILLEALTKKEIEISTFSLMIFDECHHTHAKHTFNRIMSMYMDNKLSPNPDKTALPQIVGLTASVGVGKSRTVAGAVEHIKKLMANMDAEEICTVRENMGQLSEFVNIPEEETCTVAKRENDLFGKVIVKVMETIEKMMRDSKVVQTMPRAKEFLPVLKAPAAKGSAQYQQWVSRLWKETAKLTDPAIMRFLRSCRNHLGYYNDALIIYNDARVKDALDYLEQEITRWKETAIMDDTEQKLFKIYEKSKGGNLLNYDQCSQNPKLTKLKEMILNAYHGPGRENSRGIVFVKTRNLAKAIISWMKETKELKELHPTEFLGAHVTGDRGGMTKVEQVDVLQYFRDGAHKLIVATSVAEEGLDISKCNLVIRYDHVTNEIAMVQSRGRGRAEDSKYFVLAEEGTGTAEKEELNVIREVMMRNAIIQLQAEIWGNKRIFLAELYRLQDSAKLERDLEAFSKKRKLIQDGEFELRCSKCCTFICMSTDVKKIQDAHHAVLDDTFEERADIKKFGSAKVIDETIQFVAKILCKQCGNNLGTETLYKTWPFPVIKIESFLIVDSVGRQDTCKRWKSVPFSVAPLTDDDLRELLRKRMTGARPRTDTTE